MQDLSLNDSSSDEYRSVIDDLTVENQCLKRKLKKYQRLHSSHLRDDRLFEVTFHGLSSEKRQELETKLREFASSVDDSSPDIGVIPRGTTTQHWPSDQRPVEVRPSTPVGWSRPTDSGYGSISTTGLSCLAPRSLSEPRPVPSEQSQHRNADSYSLDVSDTLRPEQLPFLTERMKKKLVVRRLEQLFTGKVLRRKDESQSSLPHRFSGLATEVARSGMDRTEQSLAGEGAREALILPSLADNLPGERAAGQAFDDVRGASGASTPSRSESSQQRPTRPIDLDIRRMQYPAENFEYIQHLGMSIPGVDPTANAKPSDGWVHLNLLANMAQLHMINVTPGFIRAAVSEMSTKLKLSKDGRKIRWRSGARAAKFHGGHIPADVPSSPSLVGEKGHDWSLRNKRRKSNHGLSTQEISIPISAMRLKSGYGRSDQLKEGMTIGSASAATHATAHYRSSRRNDLAYTPLFFHTPTVGHQDDSNDPFGGRSPESSLSSNDSVATTEAQLPSLSRNGILTEPSNWRQKYSRGPLIFFKGAKFFTDLSGDRGESGKGWSHTCDYDPMTTEIIGCATVCSAQTLIESGSSMSRPLLAFQPQDEVDELMDDLLPTEISVPPDFDSARESKLERLGSQECSVPLPLDVSGLAGVHPADNFMIEAEIRRLVVNQGPNTYSSDKSAPGFQATELRSKGLYNRRDALLDTKCFPGASAGSSLWQLGSHGCQFESLPIKDEVLSATRVDLLPSPLPPPSYYLTAPSQFHEEDDDDHEVLSASPRSNCGSDPFPRNTASSPPHLTRALSTPSTPGPDDSASSSSMDLLAWVRKEHPLIIAEQERAYDDINDNDSVDDDNESDPSSVSDSDIDLEARSSVATAGG